jgi:hypothetical protein
MHLYSEYEGSRTIRAQLIMRGRMVNTRQARNDLEQINQGHSAQNSSESLPRCTHILNMKVLQPLGPHLSRGEEVGRTDGHTDELTQQKLYAPLRGHKKGLTGV